jgi:hypothetical protein
MRRDEGDGGQTNPLRTAGHLELENAAFGRRLDDIDEVDPARLQNTAQKLEEMRGVVVSGEDDNRRDLCQDAQRVAGQLEVVNCRPRTVEEIAGVDRQVGREFTPDIDRLLENVSEVFAPLGVAIRPA